MDAASRGAAGFLVAGRFRLDLAKPLLMGVVNVTPDSFSDGGKFLDPKAALAHALRLAEEGADILDIGGESSRPGALPVSVSQEMDRILPVLEGLKGIEKALSVDTRRPEVMQAALRAGASMINDIEALQAPGAIEAVAKSQCAVCLMHMKGEPATMQKDPHYDDVVAEVASFLRNRIEKAVQAGIARERIVIDPGFGFGKTAAHNFELLRRLEEFAGLGVPILAGWSRKSTLGKLTGRPADERLAASLAAALLALQGGATILRVHDVRETRDMIAVWSAFKNES
ncbi:MAG TPA: dihydropteroate synthase [Reyranella sp.]